MKKTCGLEVVFIDEKRQELQDPPPPSFLEAVIRWPVLVLVIIFFIAAALWLHFCVAPRDAVIFEYLRTNQTRTVLSPQQ